MSNPVPFQSRDDVLASIRRLVLEEAPRSPGPGRLLLTPALRVAPPDPVIRETPAEAVEPPAIIAQAVAESVSELLRDHRHPAPADPLDAEPSPFLPVDPPEPSAAGGVAEIASPLSEPQEGQGQDASGDAAEEWQPLTRPAAATALSSRMPGVVPPPPPPPPPALDDDRLRRLIAEVVREELQGELGERMTRNIRRLVRREVFRILESRDD